MSGRIHWTRRPLRGASLLATKVEGAFSRESNLTRDHPQQDYDACKLLPWMLPRARFKTEAIDRVG
jgi:hypothetical protein